jgi:hypothetical protein
LEVTVAEMIAYLFERCSYVTLSDDFRDFRSGTIVCRGDSCKTIVDRDDRFCKKCGINDPQTRSYPDPERRFRVTASTHGICYPWSHSGPTWEQALARAVREAQGLES